MFGKVELYLHMYNRVLVIEELMCFPFYAPFVLI